MTGLVLVVSLPGDSGFAPGRTFGVAFEHLFDQPLPTCTPPGCAHLPGLGVVSGSYLISPKVTLDVNWNLGNAPNEPAQGKEVAIPVHATYRPLWGPSGVDAAALGLPLEPVAATSFATRGGALGVGGGPSIAFDSYLQATTSGGPAAYVRTLVPDPPFDQAFAPEVRQVQISPTTSNFEADQVETFEKTKEEPELGPTIPTFNIARADGLDGWTAYLRDASTRQTISSVRPLSGTSTSNVVLATNYVPARTDALTNAQLILAPPPGTPAPSGVFAPLAGVLPAQETYPPIAPPVAVSGTVTGGDGNPAPADLVFEATAIIDRSGRANVANFEFVAQASTATGAAAYSVVLPQGRYRVSVRPRDPLHAVTIFDPFVVDTQRSALGGITFAVESRRPVHGRAIVADGRPLSGASVVAVPVQCSQRSSDACMPRGSQTTSAGDGSFGLALDPGVYTLAVRPADDTQLPWVARSLSIASAPVTVPPISVPAPVDASLEIRDPGDNPIIRAVVRVFNLPAQGPAVELGRAVTDASGRYRMSLALPVQ